MKRLSLSAATLVLVLMPTQSGAVELRVDDAWIKQLPPSVPVRAGYMTLFNPLDRSVRIVAAHSDEFAAVEFHLSVMQDGMMHMQQVPLLEVEAGAFLRLEPGALHLMLMQPAEAGSPGEVRRISLEFDDGSMQELEFEIRE
jgi:copper(I)-binding protein